MYEEMTHTQESKAFSAALDTKRRPFSYITITASYITVIVTTYESDAQNKHFQCTK